MFFVVGLVLAGCAKPECKTNSDCASSLCTLSKCQNSKCVYTLQRNCCGNRINESIENGRVGSQCSCPQDYGKCEGKGKIKIGSRLEDAAYVRFYCDGDRCVLGVEEKDVSPQTFLDSINAGFFKASSVVKYNKPFSVNSGTFEFKITLDDTNKDLVLPVKLTKIKLLFNSESARTELLIAEQDLDSTLNAIGNQAIIGAALNLNYKPQQAEESGPLRYIIDYVYTKRVANGRTAAGETIYSEETVRATYTAPAKNVIFFKTE